MPANKAQQGSAQQQQQVPGSLFRVPRFTTQKRFIADARNTDVVTTLHQGSAAAAATTTLDQLDIIQNLLVFIDLTETFTPGSGMTITTSSLFPYNWLGECSVQFESAFQTFRQPGIIAAVMQGYRPIYNPTGVGMLTNASNFQQGEVVTSALT